MMSGHCPPDATMPMSAAAGWATRTSQRPHAVVEKRYRASINEKIDALRNQLEARKRPKHVDLQQALLAICKQASGVETAASTPTQDHVTGGQDASGPPRADSSAPAPPSRMNKAEVLIEAVDYIQKLEDENEIVMKQLAELVNRLRATRQALLPPTLLTSEQSPPPSSP